MGKSELSEERVLGSSCSRFISQVVFQFGVFKDIFSWHSSSMTIVVMSVLVPQNLFLLSQWSILSYNQHLLFHIFSVGEWVISM